MAEKKKAPESRPVVIPAEYIIKCIADDKTVQYPVTISYVNDKTTGLYMIESRQRLLEMLGTSFIYNSGMIRITKKPSLYLDLAPNGKFYVKNTLFPDLPKDAAASLQQVQDLYQFSLNN